MKNGALRKPSRLEESIDALRLRIMAKEPKRSQRNDAIVVMLTSRSADEGVSTVAVTLARTFARKGDGRVLLVDADQMEKGLLSRAPGGRATLIDHADKLDPQSEIETVSAWDVDLIALAPGSEGGKSFDGAKWEEFTSAMRSRYDVIIVDAGTLKSGVPQFWADKTSQVLLVVDTTRTTLPALERLGKELKAADFTLSGVIMNKRDYPIPEFLY